jgi:hypothetical protein
MWWLKGFVIRKSRPGGHSIYMCVFKGRAISVAKERSVKRTSPSDVTAPPHIGTNRGSR